MKMLCDGLLRLDFRRMLVKISDGDVISQHAPPLHRLIFLLERLQKAYLASVGGSATFNLNIPPMPSGRFDPRDVERLRELGDWLRAAFGRELAPGAALTRTETSPTQCDFTLTLPAPVDVRYLTLAEDIASGQRVERFMVLSGEDILFSGATIGSRRICDLQSPKTVQQLTIRILSARDRVERLDVRLY